MKAESVVARATDRGRRRRWSPPLEAVVSPLVLVAVIGLWEGAVRLTGISPLVLPAPSRVIESLADGFGTGFFYSHFAITLTEIILGFALGSALGWGLGVLLAQSPTLLRIANPYIVASQAVPKLALAPIFALWFGFGMTPKIVIAALIAFFPLLENTVRGLTEVDADRLELFRVLRADRRQVFTKLRLPNAMPYIFTGLRVAMILAVVGAVVGEYVGANQGLGALIIASQGNFKTSQMFAVIIILTAIGVLLYKAVEIAEAIYVRHTYGDSRDA
jgi:NitT/TauT family transport system permease protein